MEPGRHIGWAIQGRDTEIERIGLMLDMSVERRTALSTKGAVPEATGSDAPNGMLPGLILVVGEWNGREYHARRTAVQLASAAVTPTGVERLTG